MRSLIERMIQQALSSHVEHLAGVGDALNEVQRQLSNMIRVGVLTSVDPAQGRCRVQHGECLSPWVRYFMPAAGEVKQSRHPSVGEQCLLFNYGGGDSSAQTMALCGLPCDGFPLASVEGHISATEYPDGLRYQHDSQRKVTEIQYSDGLLHQHDASKKVTVTRYSDGSLHQHDASKKVTLTRYSDGALQQYDATAQQMQCQVASSSIVMDPMSITLMAGGSMLRVDAAGITLNGAMVTHAGINIGNTHVHPNVQKGIAKTDPPEG